ncbi:hypothetical protein M9H77_01242 [Catharanthus roseus]|uniref:Uncharacterized protein n=1 Tax=Catharanthus roseus TaxID=4058 RepID=A0ACC0C4Y7_CATRO|nr:hypothetical protein M9H77_01242 [Catharanthus roseus]
MNHHCVPDFDMDDDYSIPTTSSSSLNRSKKTPMGDEDIMELLWQDGQVVVQSQNQRSFKKSPVGGSEGEIPTQQQSSAAGGTRDIRSVETDAMAHQQQQQQQQLFMHEDEMASWLHYPIDDSSFDRDIYSDLLYPPLSTSISSTTTTTATIPGTNLPPREIRTTTTEIRPLPPPPPSAPVPPAPRPPVPLPPKCTAIETPAKIQNFMHFSRLPKTRIEPGPSSSSKAAKELTVVESNDSPRAEPESRVSQAADSAVHVSGGNVGCGTVSVTAAAAGTSTAGREFATPCDLTVTSSPGGSGDSFTASVEPHPIQKPTRSTAENRKRKGREPDDAECHSEGKVTQLGA